MCNFLWLACAAWPQPSMIDAQDDLLLMGKQSLACMGLLCCQAANALLCFLLVTNPKTKQCKQLRGRSPCCLPDLSLSLFLSHTHSHTHTHTLTHSLHLWSLGSSLDEAIEVLSNPGESSNARGGRVTRALKELEGNLIDFSQKLLQSSTILSPIASLS